MSTIVHQQVNRVVKAVGTNDGTTLVALLSFNIDQPNKGLTNALNRPPSTYRTAFNRLASPYDDMIKHHFSCQHCLANSRYEEAYKEIAASFTAFAKILSTSVGNWLVPLLHVLVVQVRRIASKADAHSGKAKPENIEDAERVIKQCFRSVLTCREPLATSKKWGALLVINTLFKIYFKLNNLRLCQNLIKLIPQLPPLSDYPISQYVTYSYFIGRLALLEGNLSKARESLYFAFSRCAVSSRSNKRTILMYLIPVQLSFGKLPSQRLLKKYRLPQFEGIVKAYRNGNIRAFNEALHTNLDFFLQNGIYLVLERLKYNTYRNLFRHIYIIKGSCKVPIAELVHVLNWLGEDTDVDEVECIVANLIVNKCLKGYISHRLHTLVLSRKDAFPPLQA